MILNQRQSIWIEHVVNNVSVPILTKFIHDTFKFFFTKLNVKCMFTKLHNV
jgi:hypothetical protein